MPLTQEERNKTLIRSYIDEIFNKHKLSSIERYFGGNYVEGSPQAGKGGEGFKQFLTNFFNAFPDWRATIEHIVAENNLVMVFLNGTGTQPVDIRSADLYKIENEIITGHWDVVDQLNLLKQTGALLSEDVNKELKDAKNSIDHRL
jgi:predicted SnoaL-like aldol condensation-catalyzing enzyme